MAWYEAMPPLVIITAALGAMGSLQALVHRAFNDGKVTDSQVSFFVLHP